jgi:hypothetical protein
MLDKRACILTIPRLWTVKFFKRSDLRLTVSCWLKKFDV